MKFLPIHTKRCVHSKFFLHLIIIRCGKVSSKSNMIESCSWDYDLVALLFNTLWEKYLCHEVAPPSFPSFLPSTCFTSNHNKCNSSLDFASTNFFCFSSPLGRIGLMHQLLSFLLFLLSVSNTPKSLPKKKIGWLLWLVQACPTHLSHCPRRK